MLTVTIKNLDSKNTLIDRMYLLNIQSSVDTDFAIGKVSSVGCELEAHAAP